MPATRNKERDDTEERQRLHVDWAETKRRLGTNGRDGKRRLMPGWVVVARLPLYKPKRQLPAWKRVRTKIVLRGGQRTITPFLPVVPRPCDAPRMPAATPGSTANPDLTSDRRTQTTIPFARAQPHGRSSQPAGP